MIHHLSAWLISLFGPPIIATLLLGAIAWLQSSQSIISPSTQLIHIYSHVNTLRPRQNGRHFADDILKCIFLNENVWIPIQIAMEFVPKGSINNIPALVQIMAWRRPGDKPLFEPMMLSLTTSICVTRSQWVPQPLKDHQVASSAYPKYRNMTIPRSKKNDISATCPPAEPMGIVLISSLSGMVTFGKYAGIFFPDIWNYCQFRLFRGSTNSVNGLWNKLYDHILYILYSKS